MKKLILTATLLLTALQAIAVDYEVVVGGVVYTWDPDKGGYMATGWDQVTTVTDLRIRSVINNLDVIGVADNAFNFSVETGVYTDKAEIKTLVIDDGVETIGNFAFVDCTDLTWASIPASVVSIGDAAFFRCSAMKLLLLGEGLERIEDQAFAYCSSLTMVVIPSTVRHIGSQAFLYCTGVTDAYFTMESTVLSGFDWWDGLTPHGGTEFNTVANTVLHVPQGQLQGYIDSHKFDAWLSGAHEDDDRYPLWWIVNFGIEGRTYTIIDELTAVYAHQNGNLYCKDDNKWLIPDLTQNGEINYMSGSGLIADRHNVYDQSNWVALTAIASPASFNGHTITGESITGVLTDKLNPTIQVTSTPTMGESATYVPNTYIPASVMGRTQKSPNGFTYSFVRPKPQEYAKYTWTVYRDNYEFYLPAPEVGINVNELMGGFKANLDLYEAAAIPTLTMGEMYPFVAITRRPDPSSQNGALPICGHHVRPYTESGLNTDFDVCPLSLPSTPHTGISDTSTGKGCTTGRFNVLGQPVGDNYRGIIIENGTKRVAR